MNLLEAKIYYDGSNWIAIPHTERPYRQRRPRDRPEKSEGLQKFERRFTKVKGGRANRKAKLLQEFAPMFKDEDEAVNFVEQHFDRLSRNRWERYKRMIRRGYSYRWNYFCTFTYDSEKPWLAVHRRMGTRRVGREIALPHPCLYTGWTDAGRIGGTRRLQHQAAPTGKKYTEQLFQRAVRTERFFCRQQYLRSRRQHKVYAQIHKQER